MANFTSHEQYQDNLAKQIKRIRANNDERLGKRVKYALPVLAAVIGMILYGFWVQTVNDTGMAIGVGVLVCGYGLY